MENHVENLEKGWINLEDLDSSFFNSLYKFRSNTGEYYEITFNNDGSIKNIECTNKKHYPFDLKSINRYWFDKGFSLIHAIAATISEEGPGDEDRLGLGYMHDTGPMSVDETFKKHLGLLRESISRRANK